MMFASLLFLLFFASVISARRCAPKVRHLPCGNFSGILYSSDGRPPTRVSNLTVWRPLNVSAHSSLSLSICNVGNHRVHDTTVRGQRLIPTAVGDIGRDAHVRVLVQGSGNLYVTERLVIGMVLPEWQRHGMQYVSHIRTAVVGQVVHGLIGDGAHLSVEVRDVANVQLFPNTRDLHIGKGTLLSDVVHMNSERRDGCARYVCVEVEVEDSANVKGSDGQAIVFIRDGQLDDETFDGGCLGRDAFVNITKNDVSNVRNVAEVHIYDGQLSDDCVDVGNMKGAIVNVHVNNIGNVHDCSEVRIVDGELVDMIIDAKHVHNSYINVNAKNIGNVNAHSVTIHKAELVDDIVNTGSIIDSDVLVKLSKVGNVKWAHFLNIYNGQLVDEVVDANFIRDTNTAIVLRDVGNAETRSSTVIHSGELVDEVLDSMSITRGKIMIDLLDVANVRCVPGAALVITHGQLLENVVDVKGIVDGTDAKVKIENSGFVHLSPWAVSIVNGSVAKRPVRVTGDNSGVELKIVQGRRKTCPVAGKRQ